MLFWKTIDSILSDITAKIEQLHSVADAHAAKALVAADEASLHTKLHDFAVAEEARARKIAAKFTELVS